MCNYLFYNLSIDSSGFLPTPVLFVAIVIVFDDEVALLVMLLRIIIAEPLRVMLSMG